MEPADVLRDSERRLATQFGVSQPPHALSGENLDCNDPRDARHWVRVYSELVDFMHSLMESPARGQFDELAQTPDRLPDHLRAMTLQTRVLELHLAFWSDRLHRLDGDR